MNFTIENAQENTQSIMSIFVLHYCVLKLHQAKANELAEMLGDGVLGYNCFQCQACHLK
jgi:hypothetical protein